MWPFSSSFRRIVDPKLQQRDALIANVTLAAVDSKDSDAILNATATEIVAGISRGEWTASRVVDVFIAQAVAAHKTTHCLTEILFQQAQQQARELDAEFAATKQLRGPLHGVPISIKDLFDIAGFDSSIGFSARLNQPAETDADIVALLKSAGGIPFVKTNVPQTMFSFECTNPVFGRTTNPYNASHTPGGSSGGEAALIAMDGSPLGVGSDIGGSLRIPASYCGIYSFKPGLQRVSYIGASGLPGAEGITPVPGPMARSVADLDLFCRLAFGAAQRSLTVAPIPYRDQTLPEKLRFGYYTGAPILANLAQGVNLCADFYFKSSPAAKRAVLETVAALRAQGHECIEIEVPNAREPFEVFVGATSADGYKTLLSGVGSDPLDPKFAGILRSTGSKPVFDLYKWIARRNQYNSTFYKEVWDKFALDALIAPVQAMPAIPHDTFSTLFALASSTVLYNVVNSPVGTIPVTRVDPAQDKLTDLWTKMPGISMVERLLYAGRKPIYDPVSMVGLPVGIQLVGRIWEDEKVLAMMKVVDSALGSERGFGPRAWSRCGR
ncbi:unnamed protein product [Mycena citricolor]|uniref:amidase n=1 Tax=Mycena citricolor TaxID=2018698 RepID=A0AAD2HSP9_9AGAR|nr:unnamed protein product [Mycena citricolor]